MAKLTFSRFALVVMMPMISHRSFSRGPPLLPGLTAAECWMKVLPFNRRLAEETMPSLIVCSRTLAPRPGLPMAQTFGAFVRRRGGHRQRLQGGRRVLHLQDGQVLLR